MTEVKWGGGDGIILMDDEFADLNPVLIRVPNRPFHIFLFDTLFIGSITSLIQVGNG